MGLGFGHDEIHFLKMECEGTYAKARTADDSVAFLLYSGGHRLPLISSKARRINGGWKEGNTCCTYETLLFRTQNEQIVCIRHV